MALIVLVSAKGSPGVTTSALALAALWPRRVLLAECDPAGGDVTPGFLQASTPPVGGLLELALAARRGLAATDVLSRCLRLSETDDRVLLLPGLTDPAHAAAVTPMWPRITAALRDLGASDPARDVLADAGRLPFPPEPDLLTAADRVLLVLRPTLAQVHHARHQLSVLRCLRPQDATDRSTCGGRGVGLLLVGDRPYGPGDVQTALETPVVAVLAHDPRAAAALGDGTARGRWFDRSQLVRSVRRAAAALTDMSTDTSTDTTPDPTPEGLPGHGSDRAGQHLDRAGQHLDRAGQHAEPAGLPRGQHVPQAAPRRSDGRLAP